MRQPHNIVGPILNAPCCGGGGGESGCTAFDGFADVLDETSSFMASVQLKVEVFGLVSGMAANPMYDAFLLVNGVFIDVEGYAGAGIRAWRGDSQAVSRIAVIKLTMRAAGITGKGGLEEDGPTAKKLADMGERGLDKGFTAVDGEKETCE